MFKTALKLEFVFETIIVALSGAAWAAAGFPHFMEVAVVGGLGLLCVGAYIAMIWNKE